MDGGDAYMDTVRVMANRQHVHTHALSVQSRKTKDAC
jgi:hypothetical protein